MKIKMQLFGSFALINDTAVLGEEKIHSNKLTCLLAYLLLHRDTMLTHRQLIEVFWEGGSKNPEGALKNLMYRIRNELKALGDEKFICTLPGAYRWNPDIEVETDYEAFEAMAGRLRLPGSSREREELCRALIACYRGNVSVKIADEAWILPKVTWYRSVYMDTVKKLCGILEQEARWEEMEMLCNQVLNVDALDEDIHCCLLKSMFGQKKYDLALIQYEKAKRLFYENMGIRHPEKLREVFGRMMAENGEDMADIGSLLQEAREPKAPDSVFFCDYQIFRQIYRMEMRRIDRIGIAEFVALLSLRRQGSPQTSAGADPLLVEGMDFLEQSVRQSLRIGDVAARYSPSQIIILLPTCTYEAGVKVAERIRKRFHTAAGRRPLELLYEMEELQAPG